MTKNILLLSCAAGALSLGAGGAQAATATATANASASASDTGGSTSVLEVVVTAEKREQNLQNVPVAITAFTSEKRDIVGIQTIQDMTNFTPGLGYSTSTDRITLRGIGRTTNVLSADAPVANYDDGLYETFAVAAGRSSLDLDRVEVLRGPQGTLAGRNALGGALNEITVRPTSTPFAEARITYGNYNHITLEGAVSGPLNDNWKFRVYGTWEKQSQGWIHNDYPGQGGNGNVINEWYGDFQIEGKISDKLDMWTKVQSAQWDNGGGGPGSQSNGWWDGGYPTFEYGVAATGLNPGYGCSPSFPGSAVVNNAPSGCTNPALKSPWQESNPIQNTVALPLYVSLNSQWTWHADGFDIKYIGGGTYYHYILTGQTNQGADGLPAPVTSYTLPCSFIPSCGPLGLQVNPQDNFNYQELNGFFSNEINFISTGNGPLQWVAGLYEFQQHYTQPVTAGNASQAQYGQPLGAPSALCFQTGGVCAPETNFLWFDNRPSVSDTSLAAFGQVDWKVTDTVKLTVGIRYSTDRKYGTESVRLLCFAVPACYAAPELNPFIPGGIPAVDLTQLPTVVDSGVPIVPKGVTGLTTYDPATGLATRRYNASWSDPSGTAGIEWQPDADTNVYAKYGRGYKSGGYNIGIFTVLSFEPWTNSETVDSFEVGLKKEFGHFLQFNAAAYYYSYTNLQIPISIAQDAGGLSQSETAFYNVPKSVSQGLEFETTWTPVDNLVILFNYSYDDAHVTSGIAADPADPNAIAPGAKPLWTPAQCGTVAVQNGPNPCLVDIYSVGVTGDASAGLNIPQNLAGNRLPNAPRNKIAINVLYNFKTDVGTFTPSISYVWRDKTYGTLFTRSYNAAPSWDEWDMRVTWKSANDKVEIIAFGKNVFNTIGYDQGAFGTRVAGSTDILQTSGPLAGSYAPVNYIQGVNGPAGFNQHVAGANSLGIISTYYVTPPATFGLEVHYKFF